MTSRRSLALLLVLALGSCEPECFSTNDCRAQGLASATCRSGVCERDDGGVDAGVDGGEGGGDAGGAGMSGGTAGGAPGGSGGGGFIMAGGDAAGGTSAGGSSAGGSAGGSAVAGGMSAGGSSAGGSAGGSAGAGGASAGGRAGGAAGGTSGGVAGGTSGGATAGGTSGGVAGGTSGGATSGGTSGGVAGGASGGGAAGGTSGGAAGGTTVIPDAGIFTASLNGFEAIVPMADGGAEMTRARMGGFFRIGFRGPVDGGVYLAQWTLTHDGGALPTAVEVRAAVAGRLGSTLDSMSQALPQPNGTWEVSLPTVQRVALGQAYVTLITPSDAEGLIRGQLVPLGWSVAAFAALRSTTGTAAEGGVGGFLSGTTYRYEGNWTSDIVGTSAHVHLKDGGIGLAMALYADGGGVRGTASALSLINCQTMDSGCYVDVHAGASVILRQVVP